ncbi:hypothetical protein [Janthinobacterium sp. B9-8]|uniref:hypothetical protein n=1 Tax=Janthinobacterium sp. B9-8 TaxID=1236179 RepID=UPI00061D06E1|nr:hypothetical protein [Janthinobacterium sp. B9-8]AMC34770.1 hypothetical protein VN23_09180 [Janthinobacterium sp. B9-8]
MSDSQVLTIEDIEVEVIFEHGPRHSVEIEAVRATQPNSDIAPLIMQGMDYIESRLVAFLTIERDQHETDIAHARLPELTTCY